MINSASKLRARSLLRRYAVATVALGVFAGVAGGAALGIWGMARRTSTVYDRFVAYEGAATLAVGACPDGLDAATIQANYVELCGEFDYADIRAFLDGLPGVAASGRFTLLIGAVAPAGHPEQWTRQLLSAAFDPGAVAALGTPIVVAGRLADPSVASEVVVNEAAATQFGVGQGDRLTVTPYLMAEFETAGEGVEPPHGQPTTVTVVGVIRRPSDLAGRLGGASIYDNGSRVELGPAWYSDIGGDAARYGVMLPVSLEPEMTAERVIQALSDRWPDRPIFAEVGSWSGTEGQNPTVQDAIALQALGLRLVAGLIAIAGLVFAGQAVARQVRREWGDTAALDALGMTRSGMLSAAAIRAVAFTAVSIAVAAIVVIALSPFGPIGIGRAAEPSPGVSIDVAVLAVGLPVVAFAVMLFSIIPVLTIRRRVGTASSSVPSTHMRPALPPTGVAGWAMTSSRRAGGFTLGSAIIGVALAYAAGIAALSLVSSYDSLVARPARYGATWDAVVGNVGSDQQQAQTRATLASIPGIRAVGIKSGTGINSMPDATIVAAEQFIGDVDFATIISGRAPVRATEVALGRLTLRSFGARVGDSVTLVNPIDPSQSFTFKVVGEVVVNDGLSARPGKGALVTNEAFDTMIQGTLSQAYAVWVDPGVDRVATLGALQQAFPTTFFEHAVPRQILNLGLVSGQPVLLALIVALLAGAALVHALVMSVRRGRRQVAVLKTLGFRRRQVVVAVAWHASSIALAALIIGAPLGVVTGRLAWGAIVDDLGIVSPSVVPISAILVMAAVVLAVANLAALGPGIAAARTRPAVALRTE